MTISAIILFLIILILLVLSHEFGHFIVAKFFRIKVEEFGFGFPPRAFGKKFGETIYSINWLPFGGFVRLLGEDPEENVAEEEAGRSFAKRSIPVRMAVVVAGVVFNLILAWILFTTGFLTGLPMPLGSAPNGAIVGESRLVITSVASDSPAEIAGFQSIDTVISIEDRNDESKLEILTPESMVDFIRAREGHELLFTLMRGEDRRDVIVIPKKVELDGHAKIGVALDSIASVRLPLHLAIWQSGKLTGSLSVTTFDALGSLVLDVFRGSASREAVTGPIGIIGLVQTASSFGYVYLLGLTAIISVNLAVINLLPIPALDGGHILFFVIEAIIGRPLSAKVRARASGTFFFLLIGLMILVTVFDILKIFS